MYSSRNRFLIGFIISLLAIFLFVGSVSADDGSTGAIVPETAATDEAAPAAVEQPVSSEGALVDTSVEGMDATEAAPQTVTRDSGNLVVDGDPVFSVGTYEYHFVNTLSGDCNGVKGYCEVSANPIQAALDYMVSQKLTPTDRKLYVEADENPYTGNVSVNGASEGVEGLTGIIGDGSEGTTINGDVTITSTPAGFTLSGFTVNGGVTVEASTGTVTLSDLDVENDSDTGILIVNQMGGVVLKDVESSNNYGNGAFVTTSNSGVYPVNVTNSEFDDNGGNGNPQGLGLLIGTKGNITINGLSASDNSGTGLSITTPASFSLSNAVLSNNHSDNVRIYDGNGLFVQNYGVGTIKLKNVQANENSNNGLVISSYGVITLIDTNASGNGFMGAYLGYTMNPYPTSVSVTNGEFSSNGTNGLFVYSMRNILLNSVSATDNSDGYGAYLDNCLIGGFGYCGGSGTVTLLNQTPSSVSFSQNDSDGLAILSSGAVTVNNVNASENTGNGLYVKNNFPGKTGGVTINGFSSAFSTDTSGFNWNDLSGIVIYSNGAVTINSPADNPIWVTDNERNGVLIVNSTAAAASPVTLKYLYVQNNDSNDGDADPEQAYDGINISSKGTISLTGVYVYEDYSSYFTQGSGISLDNHNGSGAIIIKDGYSKSNGSRGYDIHTNGAVTLTNVEGSNNGADGAYIDNCDYNDLSLTCKAKMPVNLLGTSNKFSSNGGDGLKIVSAGAVTLNNTFAGDNDGSGIYIDVPELAARSSGAVKLVNTTLNQWWVDRYNNADYGLYIRTYGAVTVQGFNNSEMGGTGFYIYNQDAVTPQPVTLKGSNIYDAGNNGIEIYSKGAVALSDVSVSGTGNYGIKVITKGAVTAAGVDVYDAADDGIYIDNSDGNANITFTGLTFTCNYYGGGTGPCTSQNYIGNNGGNGATLITNGVVAISNFYADSNKKDGLNILNGGEGKAITLTSIYANNNWGDGVEILSLGPVTWKYGSADENDGNGAAILNLGSVGKPVSLTNVSILGSGLDGLSIDTRGVITLSGVSSQNNGGAGAVLDNSLSLNPLAVTISNSTFSYNSKGLNINSRGAVSLLGVDVQNNFLRNTYIGDLATGVTYESYLGEEAAYKCNPGWCNPDSATASWTFDITAPQSVSFEILAGFDGEITLNDAYGDYVTGFTFSNGESSSFTTIDPLSAGTYTLIIGKSSSWDSGAYSLSLNDDNQNNVQPSPEVSYGVLINNLEGSGNVIVTKGTYNSRSYIGYNGGANLDIQTNGGVTIAYVHSYGSEGDGLSVNNTSGNLPVTISNSDFYNSEHGVGLNILSKGAIALSNIYAYSNYSGGAVLINSSSVLPQAITINNGDFSYSNDGAGLLGFSRGNIVLTNVNANGNAYDGARLDNYQSGNGVGTVTINASTGSSFTNNGMNGLVVNSNGAIKLNAARNLSANNNTDAGIVLANDRAVANPGITLTGAWNAAESRGTIAAEWNDGDGINIQSDGPVIVNYVYNYGNGDDGIQIGEAGVSGPLSVVLNNTKVNYSGRVTGSGDGINIYAEGPVTLFNVMSEINYWGNGIKVVSPANVSLKKIQTNSNNATGVYVEAFGLVTLDSISADYNGQAVYVNTDGSVVLLGTYYTNHFDNSSDDDSLVVISNNGTVTLNKFTASNNVYNGVYVSSHGKLIVNGGVTSNNGDQGFEAVVDSGAAFTNLLAFSNGKATNSAGLDVTVNGGTIAVVNSSFINNSGSGIWVKDYSVFPVKPIFTNTYYYGNDTNNTGDKNYCYSLLR